MSAVTKLRPEDTTQQPPFPPTIGAAINAIMASVKNVEKLGRNKDQAYDYVKAEDVLAKLQPEMVEHGLLIIPSEVQHAPFADSGLMTATFAYTLAHKDGEVWADQALYSGMATFRFKSGGFDDKALNKCGTAARKNFLLSLFQIPTGDLPDTDNDHREPPSTAIDMAVNLLRGCGRADLFKEAWAKNYQGWKKVLSEDDYKRVQTVKAEMVAKFVAEAEAAKAKEPPLATDDPFSDEIPF